jgi:NodT family efflux transporter outer membrane factor (OMF) lipoprotein
MRSRVWTFLAVPALSACTVGPNYIKPTSRLPATFEEHLATPAEIARTDAELRDWWRTFDDPTLDRLEASAGDNLNLRAAAQRVIEARAMRNEAASYFYPQITATGSYTDEHYSNTLEYPPLPAGTSTFSRIWELGPMLSWQVDVFGRIRRSVQAADADVGMTIEQRRGVLVSVVSEIALDYVALRASQSRLVIAERNVHAAQQGLDLVDRLFQQGLGTNLQVAQQRSEVETEQSTLPPLHTAVAQAAHAIAVLIGRIPESLRAPLEAAGPLPALPPMPETLPSTVIAQRPDVRAAERAYQAAVARIGVAVAERFPTFTIPIAATPTSSFVHMLFQSASFMWQMGLTTSAPLYTGGRLTNQVIAARASAEAARLSYQNTVLTALREVEDGLVAYQDEAVRNRNLRAAAADSRLALERSTLLFSHGLIGFLDVLNAERTQLLAEDSAAVSDLALLQSAIRLYQALGGGWTDVSARHPRA